MIIEKSSWHYKLNSYAVRDIPTNLCGYFWLTVFLVSFIILTLSGILLSFSTAGCIVMEGYDISKWYSIPIGFFIHALLISIVYCIYTVNRYLQHIIKLYKSRDIEVKEPSLLKAFIKAKKDKMCPLLTFKD